MAAPPVATTVDWPEALSGWSLHDVAAWLGSLPAPIQQQLHQLLPPLASTQPAAAEEQPAAQVAADSRQCFPLDDEDVLLTVLQQSVTATLLTATAVCSMWNRLARAELALRRISWPRASFGAAPGRRERVRSAAGGSVESPV